MKKSLQLLCLFMILITRPLHALNPYSTNELDAIEKEFVQLINQSDTVERNPLAFEYINHLGQKLAKAANMHPSIFFIVKSNEINAFAGPGGYIGINTQLILTSKTESELAAVMAHELAHVRLHHLYQMMQHEKQMQIPMIASVLASVALGMIDPTLASGALMASLTGFAQNNINLIRAHEKEADRIGIDMLTRAGFDPRGMVTFFKKMQENSRYYYTANIPALLRTHPLDEDRIAEAENRISELHTAHAASPLSYFLFKRLIYNTVNLEHDPQRQTKEAQPPAALNYGNALTALKNNEPGQASTWLTALLTEDPGNIFYIIAMAQAETASKNHEKAIRRLQQYFHQDPENYAILIAYTNALLAAGQSREAVSLLLKGFRHFKKDLTLCETLARAQAASHQQGYAYLTQAQCYLLQGRHRDALRHLKHAKHLVKRNAYLQARVEAMTEEVKFQLTP